VGSLAFNEIFPMYTVGNFNFSGSKREGMQNKSLQTFKSVLLLEKSYNTSLKYTALPGIKYCMWATEILFFYGAVKSITRISSNVALSGFFIVSFLTWFSSIVFGNTGASKVFTESNSMIRERKQKTPAWNRMRLRQIIALHPARARIGDNFIDRSTPLVAQDFVASQTATLILL